MSDASTTALRAPNDRYSNNGPRERALERGLLSLGDGELVAVVLGTGVATQPVTLLAERLLLAAGGLVGLSRLGPCALAELPGIGPAKALRLGAAIELGTRAAERRTEPRMKLTTGADVAALMGPRLGGLEHEEMWVLAVDGQNGLRAMRRVAQGGFHGCSVSVRDILRAGLLDAASGILLVHNHPSGDPTPSMEDIKMTQNVAEAAEVVGVPLLDHVVVAGKRHASFLDLGLLG